jgi:hypothetical protein
MVAVIAGATGTALASIIVRIIQASSGVELPRLHQARIDGSAALFCLAVSVLAGLTSAGGSALRAVRANPGIALRDGGRSTSGGGRPLLVTAQVAVSTALLIVGWTPSRCSL